ncbi:hypothetical protein AURDEDRAFT_177783 [Auricularia subglabra TFB-10046 SS5]|uniref:Retrotransposon gag domain-containing protein n=1 Tax=Auricularia subglabra (strain TFB-10046 / SS5) TaxID=717982 RepID=J0WMT4_AURST|nr:hypothetical protein AURDEDRAFT_177783 [Auricularia subglabra TFB-10046 SS5]
MVFTRGQLRRGSHTSDEDIATNAGSHPAGSSRRDRKQRIKKLKETIASLSPAKPGRRIFELLDEDPPDRRGSWEGPDTSATPAEEVFEGDGTLDEPFHLPSSSEAPQEVIRGPPVDFATAHEWKLGRIDEAARDYDNYRVEESALTSLEDLSAERPKREAVERGEGAERVESSAGPVVKFSAPVQYGPDRAPMEEPGWQIVSKGDYITMDDFTVVDPRRARKAQFKILLPTMFTGPSHFPPWFSHFSSKDNAIKFEPWDVPSFRAIEDAPGVGKDPDSQALVRVDRSVSRAGSSVPSLVTVSDSSDDEVEVARKTYLPESPQSSEPRSPENSPAPSPGPSRPASPPTDDAEMSRMLEMFCADILETLDDEGQEAALAYLGDVFPQNDLAINREWLRYLLECRENGSSWDPTTLDSFSLNEWPRSRAIPVWGPGLKSYRDAVAGVHSSSIGLSPPGLTSKGKAVDPSERPAATSTPKSSRTFEHFEFDFQAPAQPEAKQPSAGSRKPRKSGTGGIREQATAAAHEPEATGYDERREPPDESRKPAAPQEADDGWYYVVSSGAGGGGGVPPASGDGDAYDDHPDRRDHPGDRGSPDEPGDGFGGPPDFPGGGGGGGGGGNGGGGGGGGGNGNGGGGGEPHRPDPDDDGGDPQGPGGGGGPPPGEPRGDGDDSDSDDDDEDDELRARRKLASQMKLKQPRVYDGRADLDYFDQWCYEVDWWKRLNGIRTRWIIPMLSSFLSGEASKWFMNNVVLSEEDWTMRRFYDELFDYCFPSDFKLRLRMRFARAKQGDRDVREFARNLKVLARRFPDIGERQLIQVLWEGVHKYIRSKWFEYGFNVDENTYEELVSAAEAFEKGERARQGEDRGQKYSDRLDGRMNVSNGTGGSTRESGERTGADKRPARAQREERVREEAEEDEVALRVPASQREPGSRRKQAR